MGYSFKPMDYKYTPMDVYFTAMGILQAPIVTNLWAVYKWLPTASIPRPMAS